MFIYQIKNKINGKSYIGQTIKDPQVRWKKHISISKKESHKDTSYIHKAIRKDGIENFEFEVIDTADTREELDKKEKLHIKELNTIVPYGYNISSGGQFSKEIDEVTRKKISESKKGEKNPNWKRKFSDEEIQAHRKANLKRYSKQEEREKTGIKAKEMWSRPGFKERMHDIRKNQFTEEDKKKIGKKSRKMWSNPDFKKKMSEKRKKQWADPDFRRKILEARRKNN